MRGHKQYRYHPQWRETRDANKYERMLAFDDMPRDKVLAIVVRLLDTTLIRRRQRGICAGESFVWTGRCCASSI